MALGTMLFLVTILKYSAPLVMPEHDFKNADATTLVYNQINDSIFYSMHITLVLKESVKIFAWYLAFVIIVFAHRSFYKMSGNVAS